MIEQAAIDRLTKAAALEKGCPWELDEYQQIPVQSMHTPMLNWSADAWDAARAYLAAIEGLKAVQERLLVEVAICRHVNANGTAHSILEACQQLQALLPAAETPVEGSDDEPS